MPGSGDKGPQTNSLCQVLTSVKKKEIIIELFRSPVFRAMLQSEMQENINGVINVKDVNAEALKEMIHYMYTGNVDWNKVKNLERELLVLADKYQVQGLVHNCSSKLASSLNKDNALEIGILGEMYNSDVLIQKCAKFISSNTNKCLVRDWMEKIQKSPRLMANLIKNMKDSKDTQNSRRNYENLYDHSFFRLMEDQAQYNQNI